MNRAWSDLGPGDHLPPWRSVVVVVAHPDDESFGLGAVLAGFADAGAAVAVLCFTHGESSTLHGVDGDLGSLRAGELSGAARVLGVDPVRLLGYPDGALTGVDVDDLSAHVLDLVGEVGADGLLTFDTDGVTGHRDHAGATVAALAADRAGLTVLGWTLPGPSPSRSTRSSAPRSPATIRRTSTWWSPSIAPVSWPPSHATQPGNSWELAVATA